MTAYWSTARIAVVVTGWLRLDMNGIPIISIMACCRRKRASVILEDCFTIDPEEKPEQRHAAPVPCQVFVEALIGAGLSLVVAAGSVFWKSVVKHKKRELMNHA
ncbi:hypothetical protein R69608_07275 [Paraburkholderia nemoris]|uniref:Uncharacterized protein n=2 Tax=Burkholderiaceae TaxID=119060 RepID=A0ABM8T3G7_9BURK|nr:hypothetical protein R69619_05694 [Paraburkholderia nemoris]CAE6854227.1 hypothetical protein R69776_07652 [Paraburkholderia nemoris]CAE6861551.1 hypothetical protein R75777_08058 [Paraburkholderia nemoris]CAE6874302.1 hypothetical protein R69749_06508 [Paraburkholderia domus]CAE6969764.1 hypothetical protein R69608_07275 [Paraburkholderia nemoris]